VNQRDQVHGEWVAADIYSCFSAAIGFNAVPSHWQAVPMSVFDTHSLGRVAQSRLHWHRSHAKLFPCEKMEHAARRWLKHTQRGKSGEKVQRRDTEP